MVKIVDDASIVASLVEGDPAALAEAYRRYADRLFTYCVSMLRDHDAAADAVNDTFIVAAERVGQLRDPERLRVWLYAIARNECLRTIRDRGRSTTLDESHPDEVWNVIDQTTDVDADLSKDALRRLVWTAVDGLKTHEREVLELSVRHQVDGADLAAAIGVSPSYVDALLPKARQRLERALAALLAVGTGRRDCARLDDLLAGRTRGTSVRLRRRVARHIESCPTCTERTRREVSATALLGGTPLLAAPPELRDRVLDDVGNMQPVAEHEAIANRAGRFRDGFPMPLDRPPSSFAWQAPAVAAAGAAVFLLTGVMLLGETQDTGANTAVSPPPATPAQPPSPGPTSGLPPAQLPSTTTMSEPPDPSIAGLLPATSGQPGMPSSPPTADLLSIHCGDLAADCDEYVVSGEGLGIVELTTESEAEIVVSISEDVPWLHFTRAPIVVYPDVPAQVQFRIRGAPACSWSATVSFEVVAANHSAGLLVSGGEPCFGS